MSDKLQLTMTALNGAKDLREMFEMPAVRANAILNLVKTRGKNEKDAALHYEREKILFFKALQANKKLEACDRFTIYSSWIELHASGLSLNDGESYIIPYGKVAQFQIGWKGRLSQMGLIPEIINIPPPQVVYENDIFEYELGENPRIIKHIPAKANQGQLAFVYLLIEKKSGKELHIMNRTEVLAIRDQYSKTYGAYITECTAANVKVGMPVPKTGQYGPYTIDPPMWVTAEPEAWKKTLVKRAYKSQQNKTARMKALDERIKDADEETTHDIEYGVVNDQPKLEPNQPDQTQPSPTLPDLGNPEDAF